MTTPFGDLNFAGGWWPVPLSLALAAAFFVVYRRQLRDSTRWKRLVLPTLRAIAVLLLGLMLAQPTLRSETVLTQAGQIVLLRDRTASMDLADPQLSPGRAARLLRAQGNADADLPWQLSDLAPQLRVAAATGASFTAEQQAAVNQLAAVDGFEDVVEGETPTPDELRGLADRLDASFDAMTTAAPVGTNLPRGSRLDSLVKFNFGDAEFVERDITGDATDLAAALESIPQAEDRQQVVILASDGRHTAGSAPAEAVAAAESVARRGATLHTITFGSPTPPADVALLDATLPPAVHLEDRVAGRLMLSDTMPPGTPITLTATADGEEVWRETIDATGTGPRDVEFSFGVKALAESQARDISQPDVDRRDLLLPLTFSVQVPTDAAEFQASNNELEHGLRVLLRGSRVLILDGRPRWDTRFVESILSRDHRWELTADLLAESPIGLRAFPLRREDLLEYDLIVFGDVPPDALTKNQQQWLADFVSIRGGGLLLIDGTRDHLAKFVGTPLEDLLPVTRGNGPPMTPAEVRLTTAGENDSRLRLEASQSDNAELWQTLPRPRWIVDATAKPGSGEVLAEAIIGSGEQQRIVPMLVTARVGRGTVWYQAHDETWRWRRDFEDKWQARYWSNVAASIVEPPFSAENETMAIGVEAATARSGEQVVVRARLRDADGNVLAGEAQRGVNVEARVLDGNRVVARAPLPPDAASGGLFRGPIKLPDEPGVYQIAIGSDSHSDTDLDATTAIVVAGGDAGDELRDLTADPGFMQRLARAGGGGALREDEAGEIEKLLGDLTTETRLVRQFDLWSSWLMFGGVAVALSLEWAIRRRTGMI